MSHHQEQLNKHLTKKPIIDKDAFVHERAVVIGDVTLGPKSSIWPCAVLRGDINSIEIGEGSNIQDGTVVHLACDYGVKIGKYVTVGHLAMIHACEIKDECLIGMHATVLDGAVVGPRAVIGAGAVVTKNMVVPEGAVVMGVPGKIVKILTAEEQAGLRPWADNYVEVSAFYKETMQ